MTSYEMTQSNKAVPCDDIDEVALDESSRIVDAFALGQRLDGVSTEDLGGTHCTNNDRDDIHREDPSCNQCLCLIQASLPPGLQDILSSATHSEPLTKQRMAFIQW